MSMSNARAKIDIIYADVLAEVDRLVTRVEQLQSLLPDRANEIRAETDRLAKTLAAFSSVSPVARSRAALFVAATLGAALTLSIGAVVMAIGVSQGRWIASASDRRIVDAASTSGVDVTSLSASDLSARLSYSPEAGRLLVDALRAAGGRALIDDLVVWLHGLPIETRRQAVLELMRSVAAIQNSPAKAAVIAALPGMDETDAQALASTGTDIRAFLHQFSRFDPETRQRLVAGSFFCPKR